MAGCWNSKPNVMRTNLTMFDNDEAMLLETEEGSNPSETGIVNVFQIDSVIHEFHPQAALLSEIERIELIHAIEHHLFSGKHDQLPTHHIILQHEEIHHFLDGIRSLVHLNHIHDFEGLRIFFNHKIASFSPNFICDVK